MIEVSFNYQRNSTLKKHPFSASFNCRKQFEFEIGFSHIFHISRSDKKTMGLKPYFTYLLDPWLKPGAMEENIFYIFRSDKNNEAKALLYLLIGSLAKARSNG
ncbi:hypothetical protein [Gillisia limnaea]|uniref:Uncharacterized protein n=1 Tax=Gillisia limnaea (strain DSM 15749 / LMG 21470 / R-8282) TaxID=865937 RepID=H2BRS2_GILLR|nr:hypothetical protein [Gillisia limnaea]EHQ01387.1 hypothetical protein Gilli_0676 [Gillisia limnaea DSM 15749]